MRIQYPTLILWPLVATLLCFSACTKKESTSISDTWKAPDIFIKNESGIVDAKNEFKQNLKDQDEVVIVSSDKSTDNIASIESIQVKSTCSDSRKERLFSISLSFNPSNSFFIRDLLPDTLYFNQSMETVQSVVDCQIYFTLVNAVGSTKTRLIDTHHLELTTPPNIDLLVHGEIFGRASDYPPPGVRYPVLSEKELKSADIAAHKGERGQARLLCIAFETVGVPRVPQESGLNTLSKASIEYSPLSKHDPRELVAAQPCQIAYRDDNMRLAMTHPFILAFDPPALNISTQFNIDLVYPLKGQDFFRIHIHNPHPFSVRVGLRWNEDDVINVVKLPDDGNTPKFETYSRTIYIEGFREAALIPSIETGPHTHQIRTIFGVIEAQTDVSLTITFGNFLEKREEGGWGHFDQCNFNQPVYFFPEPIELIQGPLSFDPQETETQDLFQRNMDNFFSDLDAISADTLSKTITLVPLLGNYCAKKPTKK